MTEILAIKSIDLYKRKSRIQKVFEVSENQKSDFGQQLIAVSTQISTVSTQISHVNTTVMRLADQQQSYKKL